MQDSEHTEARRALVVEGDPAIRRQLGDALTARGFDVSACESPQQGLEHYRKHALVIAGCGANNGDVQRLVDFIRRSSGARQPYIITLGEAGSAASFPGPGVNDLVQLPIDEQQLGLKIRAAGAWLAGRSPGEPEADDEVVVSGKAKGPESAAEGDANGQELDLDLGEAAGDEESTQENVENLEDLEDELEQDDAQAWEDEERDTEPVPVFARAAQPVVEFAAVRVPVAPAIGPTTRFHLVQLIENGPLPTAMFDRSMHYLAANSRWIRAYGLENDEIIGTSHFDFFAEVSPLWQELCHQCVEDNAEVTGSESVVWADGSRENVRWIMRPWHYEENEVGGLVVSYDPVAAAAESATVAPPRASAESPEGGGELATDLAAALAQSQTAPVLVLNLHGRIMRSNRLSRQIGKWKQATGDERFYWQVFLDREDRAASQDGFVRFACDVLERGHFAFPPTSVDSIPCPDGSTRRIVWHNLPRHGPDGSINGMIRVGVDIEELAGLGREFGSASAAVTAAVPVAVVAESAPDPRGAPDSDAWLNASPVLHWKARHDGKIIFFNQAWLEFRGRRREEEIDNGWMDGLHEDDHRRLVDAFLEISEMGGRLNQLARLQGKGGDYRWMRFIIAPGRYGNASDGETFVGYCEDMTAQKHLEEEVAKLLEQVEMGEAESSAEIERIVAESDARIGALARECESLRDGKETAESDLAATRSKLEALQAEYDTMLGESAKAVEKLHFHEERAGKLELTLRDARLEVVRLHEVAAKLTDERNRFSTIPDNAPFGIIVLGGDGKLVYANPAHSVVAGSRIDGVESIEEWLRSVCPEDSDESRDALVEQWRENVWRLQRTTTMSVVGGDDSLRDLEFRPRMMRDGQLLVSIFDVTDGLRGEKLVRANEAKFRALFYDSGVSMALVDRSGAIVDTNSALERLLGRNRSEILKRSIEDFIVAADRKRREELLEELRATQARSGDVDVRLRGAGATEIGVQMNVSMIKDSKGEVLFTAYFLHPLPEFPAAGGPKERPVGEAAPSPSPQGDAPSAIDEASRMRALAFAGIHDGIVVADLKGRIIEWNRGATRLFGYEPEEILGKSLYILYEREDPKRFRDKITQGIGTQRKWEEVTAFFRKDGTEGLCEVIYVPLADETGIPLALVGVNREIGRPRPVPGNAALGAGSGHGSDDRVTGALERQLETLAELLDMQAESLHDQGARRAVGAGELRARALSLLAGHGAGSPGQIDFGLYVKALVKHLLGRVGPEHAEIQVHLNAKNVILPIEVAAPVALCLNELLTNAFTHAFTGKSSGVVAVNMSTAGEGGWLVVRDDGIGLPEWLDLEATPGLGLRIVRTMAERAGGTLRAGDGPGTEFQIGFRAKPD